MYISIKKKKSMSELYIGLSLISEKALNTQA